MKKCCIAGPVDPERHYFVPRRLDYAYLMGLIDDMQYFVLHALRQSGKTTTMELFVDCLNNGDTYAAVYINVEPAQVARDNIKEALIAIVELLSFAIKQQLAEHDLAKKVADLIRIHPITINLLLNVLAFASQSLKKPLVVFKEYVHKLEAAFGIACKGKKIWLIQRS